MPHTCYNFMPVKLMSPNIPNKTLRQKLGVNTTNVKRSARLSRAVISLGLTGDGEIDEQTLIDAIGDIEDQVDGGLGWAADLGALNRGSHTANETFDRLTEDSKTLRQVRRERSG